MTELQAEAATIALKDMMRKGRFDICCIREIIAMTGSVPDGNDLRSLSILHCVNFSDFTPRMKMEFPNLLKRVLQSPSMDIEIKFKSLDPTPGRLAEICIAAN